MIPRNPVAVMWLPHTRGDEPKARARIFPASNVFPAPVGRDRRHRLSPLYALGLSAFLTRVGSIPLPFL